MRSLKILTLAALLSSFVFGPVMAQEMMTDTMASDAVPAVEDAVSAPATDAKPAQEVKAHKKVKAHAAKKAVKKAAKKHHMKKAHAKKKHAQ